MPATLVRCDAPNY